MAQISLTEAPEELQSLIAERNTLRQQKQFQEADRVRDQIAAQGYRVEDTPQGIAIFTTSSQQEHPVSHSASFLTLFGSGEISPTGYTIHEKVFRAMGKNPVKVVIISTPAGFQPNVRVVCEEIAEFIRHSLQNYHPQVEIVYANTREDCENTELLAPLKNADYIFMGPGSPTYAINTLKNTTLFHMIIERVQEGASLSLASAATVACSRQALPVYEIFKVGEPLHWKNGLNLLSKIFQPLTIIPHFNNTEGGKKTDTSRCYVGLQRFSKLLELLQRKNDEVWGIDEQTGIIINLKTKSIEVLGKGKRHLL